jgi:hypothetical protein
VHQRCATDRKRNRREILVNKSQRLCATQYFRRAAFSVLFTRRWRRLPRWNS